MSRPAQLLLACALTVATVMPSPVQAQTSVRQTYNDDGWKAYQGQLYDEAERLYRAAIRDAESAKVEDVTYANSLFGLARVRAARGVPDEAQTLMQRSLALGEKLEPGSRNLALRLLGVGDQYRTLAKYADALAMYQRAGAIIDARTDTASLKRSVWYGTSRVLLLQGKIAEAEPYVTRSLADAEADKTLTPVDLSSFVADLGDVRWRQGRYLESETLYRRVLATRERVLGPDDSTVTSAVFSLALISRALGRVTEAEVLYKRVLATYEKTYGPDNVNLTAVLNNLGVVYENEAKYSEAETIHRRALAIREKALGPNHPDVARSLANIASVLTVQEKYAASKTLLDRAYAIRSASLGPDSVLASGTLASLSWLLVEQLQFAAAEPGFRKELAATEKEYGASHLFAISSVRNVAVSLYGQGKIVEAEQLLRRAAAIQKAQPSQGNVDEGAAAITRADNSLAAGNFPAAKAQYFRALSLYENALGPADPKVKAALEKAALIYERQGKTVLAAYFRRRAVIQSEPAFRR